MSHTDAYTYPLDINERTVFVVYELSSELSSLLRVRAHNVLQEANEVWGVSDLLRVQNDLVRLAGLSEACNDLVRNICTQVNAERQRQVVQPDDVTELFAASQLHRLVSESSNKLKSAAYLVLLEPFLQKLFASLLQNGSSELNRLQMVELSFLQKNTEILKDGREAAWWCRGLLERFNDLGCTQDTLSIEWRKQ